MCTNNVRGVRSLGRGAGVVVLTTIMWLTSVGAVQAEVVTVFDNYKPNFGTATFDGQVINPIHYPRIDRDVANSFVPTASGVVSDIWATVTMVSGVNEVDLWLMSDSGGAPDHVLEMWHLTNAMGLRGGLNPPVHVEGDGSTFLEEGEQYWLVASAPPETVAMWMYNGVGDMGANLMRVNSGSWAPSVGTYPALRGAFRVDVVPEPATLCIMALGAVTVLRRRRRRTA